ncbi:MAG TPA: 5'/3'-nucleotidase SurE, partial [Candidatus Eremiobacteraeota bacterium]|nr:5'/3'-nucleotidase SurE [Candidatus Eremiobacteraeota bacterium]
MKIFLTNDDGIEAKGLQSLIKELKKNHELLVVAPDRERSAVSHSLTLFDPLRLKKIRNSSRCNIYTTNGTPADCILLGIKHIIKDQKPDLIIAGINHGANIGDDISYSGTVAAAKEGTLQGIPSWAVSLCSYEKKVTFSVAAKLTERLLEKLSDYKLPERTLLNINIPYVSEEEIKGIVITVQGKSNYKNWIEKSLDPRKRDMYWIASDIPDGFSDKNS